MKKIITLFFYLIFLISAIFSLKLIPHIPVRYLPILELLPFVLMFISFILGIKFNRSQVIYSAILFSLIYACFVWFIKPSSSQYPLILNSITIFLSINIALISLYSERGVFTLIGLTRFIIIALQFVGISWLIYIKHPEWHHFVNQIIFPVGMSLSEVSEHLEKLRENVANNKFTLRKQERRRKGKRSPKKGNQRDVKVTISIGYAERNDKAKTPNQVLKLSDKALYKAKRKGRNCISK